MAESGAGIEAGIAIGQFFGLWVLCWSPIALVVGRTVRWDFPRPPTPAQKIPLVLSLYVLAPPLLWLFVRRSGETLQGLGWVWSWEFCLRIGFGLGLAVLSLGLFWGLEWALGWVRFGGEPRALLGAMGPVFVVAIAISTVEELLFRGFIATRLVPEMAASGLFSQVSETVSVFGDATLPLAAIAGLGLTNLIFALLHLPWDRWQAVVPQLPGLWLLGMVLSLACVRSGDLGLAIGLHGGWVWAIATLDTQSSIQATEKVPAWLTGVGGYLLAGLAGVVFLALVGWGLWLIPGLLPD